jgi:hypothetical protein
MTQFFSSFSKLESFSHSLNTLTSSHTCQHCACSDQWISHGFIYRQSGIQVGKRILCAKRYGKLGCGRTFALYIAAFIPERRYSLSVLWAFACSLIQGSSVAQAYFSAVGHAYFSHRQAYRWLSALYAQVGLFRSQLPFASTYSISVRHRSARLSILLTTLSAWIHYFSDKNNIQIQLNQRFC